MLKTKTTGEEEVNPYMRTLYGFNIFNLLGGSIYSIYYGVFLYKNTFSLQTLAIDGLMGALGLWAGYLLGVTLVRRLGYNWCIRSAFVLFACIAFGTALITNHIASWFMLIAIIKALPAGMYSAAAETILLNNVATKARSGFMQLNLAMEFVVSIFLPAAVGALITVTASYTWAFVAAGIVYVLSFGLRCQLPKPEVTLDLRSLMRIFKKPLYAAHACNRTITAGFNQLNALALTILPFLLLGSELSMGILASITAAVGAVVSLRMRRSTNTAHQVALGYGAHSVKLAMSSIFVLLWTAPAMALWQVVGKVMTPLHDPVQQGIDVHNDALILGKEAKKQALEINMLNTTLKLVGSIVAFGAFIVFANSNTNQQQGVLTTVLISFGIWRIVSLMLSAGINKLAQRLEDEIPLRLILRDKLTALSYVLYMRYLRLRRYALNA